MIRIVAFSPEDGWAFVEEDGALYQVRPPYRREVLRRVGEAEVARSIGADGFRAIDRQEATWADVVRFLRQEVARSRPEDASPEGQRREVHRFLSNADESILAGFLQRIETEYLAQGNYALAQRAVDSMMKVDRLRRNPDLWDKATEIWRRAATRQIDVPIRFSSMTEEENDYCRRLQPEDWFASYAA